MSQEKYIGMDVHQATISVAVMDSGGKLIMECILETKAGTIVEFIKGLHSSGVALHLGKTHRGDGSATGNRSCDPLNFAHKNGEFLLLLHLQLNLSKKSTIFLSDHFLHKNWAANMRSRRSILAMVCSASILHQSSSTKREWVKRRTSEKHIR
jgi:hypothetical protein